MMKKQAIIGGIMVVGSITAGVVYLTSHLDKSASAVLESGKAGKSAAYQIDLTPKLETGKYVSFDYPKGLLTDSAQTDSSFLENFNFSVQDIETWFLAVTISKSPLGKLTDSTSYTYRQNNPTLYSESRVTINGQAVDIMTDREASGFSVVAFVLHGDELATISLHGDDLAGAQPLQATLTLVLSSLRWP